MLNLFKKPNPVGLTVKDERENEFEFKRTYRLPLTDEVTLELKADQRICMTYSTQLTQKNGKSVHFHYQAVAESILDETLVPLVENGIKYILAEDRLYRANKKITQTTIIDSNGQKWVRV